MPDDIACLQKIIQVELQKYVSYLGPQKNLLHFMVSQKDLFLSAATLNFCLDVIPIHVLMQYACAGTI